MYDHPLNQSCQDDYVPLLSQVLDIGLKHMFDRDYSLKPVVKPESVSFQSLPENSLTDDEIITQLTSVSRESVNLSSPGFLGFPDGSICKPAIAAAVLEPFLNQNLANQDILSPKATFVELETIHWLRGLVGYRTPSYYKAANEIGGIVTQGGTLSNTIAVMAGREMCFPGCFESGIPVSSDAIRVLVPQRFEHYSIRGAMGWLSLGQENLVRIPPDRDGRMDLSVLESTIRAERACGNFVVACVAYAGDSRALVVDNLAGIADVLQRHNVWFHVDACHGMQLLFSEKLRHRLDGIDLAHSISFDPHKVLSLPYPCSTLLFKNPSDLRRLCLSSDLILNTQWSSGQVSPFIGSKNFLSLKLWCTIKGLGRLGIEKLVNKRIEMTSETQNAIRNHPDLHLLNHTDVNSCMFIYLPWDHNETDRKLSDEDVEKVSKVNELLSRRLRDDGVFFVHNFPVTDWKHKILPLKSTLTVLRIVAGTKVGEKDSIGNALLYITQVGRKVWDEQGLKIVAPPLCISQIFKGLREEVLDPVFKKDHVALVYGSSIVRSSILLRDVDMMVFIPDNLLVNGSLSEDVVILWERFMRKHGILMDDEIPLAKKLIIPYSFAERAASSANGHLSISATIPSIVCGQGLSRKVVLDTSSDTVLYRLVFNVLTAPSELLSFTPDSIKWLRSQRETAERALVDMITKRNENVTEWNGDTFSMHAIECSGRNGEYYLGYKKRPLIKNFLKEIWSKHGKQKYSQSKCAIQVAPSLLIINGFPGVGKYSIAKEVHKCISNSRLIDNHIQIDLVSAVEPDRTEGHFVMRKRIRRVLIDSMIAVTNPVVFVLTECLSSMASDCTKLMEYIDVGRRSNIPIIVVNLTCDLSVHEKRLLSSERISGPKKKLTDVNILRAMIRDHQLLTEKDIDKEELHDLKITFKTVPTSSKTIQDSVASILALLH